ncbi:hypothetical protein [Flavobacterium filum]|mgnify:CR=1 FL=1|uniref:hypothetical protein n=1 Tax=Flavobacterium filum TaxID=370974 RepID=UPI0023EF9F80|nr:hypothetical protein [Flavobacterium filum]
MNSILTDNLREDFFIRLYFDDREGFHKAGIKRAFLDFSRTLKIQDDNRATLKANAENFILTQLNKATQTDFNSQEEFDNFHKLSCVKLIETWTELKFGQAQKWINMTLKYWLLLGENRIARIERNAKYFHIPIDSYVQKGMFGEKYPNAWSKIDDYETYMNYQREHRNKKTGNYPIIDEFNFFNSYKP